MKEKIWLSSPHMGNNEVSYVKQAFDSNWIAPVGPNLSLFEEGLKKITNSCSSIWYASKNERNFTDCL